MNYPPRILVPAGRRRSAMVMLAALFLILLYGCVKSVIFIPTDPKQTCVASPVEVNSWFESGAVTLNGVVKPADSVNFPDSPNCSFYRWSEQMFLWLTSPAPPSYGGGAHIFDSPSFFDVSPPDAMNQRHLIPHKAGRIRSFSLRASQVGRHHLPTVFDRKGKLFELEPPVLAPSGRQLLLNAAGSKVEVAHVRKLDQGGVAFLDPEGKPIERPRPIIRPELSQADVIQKITVDQQSFFLGFGGTLVDVEQNQADNGVLVAQNGSLVYFTTMVNDVFAYFLTGTKTGGIVPTPTQFPTTQSELDQIVAFATGRGVTLKDPEALAIEVKASWIEAAGLPELDKYITMRARIPVYDKTNPNLWVKTGETTALLAMVGMHVVGSAAGHPEMIWATFEHVSNAPNEAYAYINTANAVINVPRTTAGIWTFCSPSSVGPFNAKHATFTSPDIQSTPGFTISPSDTLRSKPWGGASNQTPNPLDASTAASNTEIIAINNSVRNQLIAGDVRRNYYMTGSTWTIGGSAPTGSFNLGNEVGTSKLANTTMETYDQGTNLFAHGTNCFTCHVTNTTDVSHIFPETQPIP